MGRKSRNKKDRFERLSKAEKVRKHKYYLVYGIFIAGITLFLLGIFTFEKTFASYTVQLSLIFVGTLIGTIIFHYTGNHKLKNFRSYIFFGFFLGGSFFYSFLAITNYYFKQENAETITLAINKTGYYSRMKSRCKSPYAEIEYEGIHKKIRFGCEHEQSISNYKYLTLKVSNGFWGYKVYTEKQLVE